jgi:hypothetical protein
MIIYVSQKSLYQLCHVMSELLSAFASHVENVLLSHRDVIGFPDLNSIEEDCKRLFRLNPLPFGARVVGA